MLNVARRFNRLQFDACYVHTPADRRFFYHFPHTLVDHIAAAESSIKLHLADDIAQSGTGQSLERVWKVLYRIGRLLGIGNAVIDHGVNIDGDVILGNYRLAREVQHLLAKIDAGGMSGCDPLYTSDVALEITNVDCSGQLEKRDEHVKTRACQSMKTP